MLRVLSVVAVLVLAGCQSLKEKNIELIQDRADKLKPLMTFKPTWCRLETKLTEPAKARYREMFPEDVDKLGDATLNYTWKARKYNCEITPLDSSELTKNHQGFLETAICTLLQVYWVNSPFEELQMVPRDIKNEKDGRIHIEGSMIDKELGVYLDPVNFNMDTRTKSRGVLKAVYGQVQGQWLPVKLEQVTAKADLVVDEIEYETVPVGGRKLVKSLWISVGDKDQVMQHTQVLFTGCRNF
jgi:hypothetical protein